MSDYRSGIIEQYNDPIKIINETKKVHSTEYFISLEQIPDEFHRVKIDGMTEVTDIDNITENSFRVDYNSASGRIFFHSSKAGQDITVKEYWGIGVVKLFADRIVTQIGEYGEAISTLESDIEVINQMKDDYYNGTHFEVMTSQQEKYVATRDNVNVIQIPVGLWNPLIDVLDIVWNGYPLIKDVNYLIDGGQIVLLDWVLSQGDILYFDVKKGVNNTPPVGADGSNLMNGSITQLKLSSDVQDKLNKFDLVTKELRNYVKLTEDKTNISIGISGYSYQDDVLYVYKDGSILTKDINYIINENGTFIDKVGDGVWESGSEFDFVVLKNVSYDSLNFTNGSYIQDLSIPKTKLTNDIQTRIDMVDEHDLVLDENAIQLNYVDKLKLKFVYGINGDGTDETEKLKTAIANESMIYIPRQMTIGISSTITISKPIKILSDGGCVKCLTNGMTVFFLFNDSNNIIIDNVRFDDNLKGRTILEFANCNGTLIKNCYFTGYSKDYGYYQTDSAIRVNGSVNMFIDKNIFENFGHQYSNDTANLNRCITINDTNCDWISITNNQFVNVNQAICSAGKRHQIISGNMFNDVKDNCLYLTEGFEGAIVSNNVFKNNNDEAIVIFGKDVIINGNKFYNTPNKAIAFTGGDSYNIEITNNMFINDTVTTGQFVAHRSYTYTVNNLKVEGNIFKTTSNTTNYAYFDFGNVNGLSFKNNNIQVPTVDYQKIINLQGATISKGWCEDNFINGSTTATLAFDILTTCTTIDFTFKNNDLVNCRASYNNNVVYDGMNVQLNVLYITGMNKNKKLYGTNAPTIGTWNVGDKVYNSSPSAGGCEGWICTTSGTPGIWKAFGTISS